jgi:hypothetical protein
MLFIIVIAASQSCIVASATVIANVSSIIAFISVPRAIEVHFLVGGMMAMPCRVRCRSFGQRNAENSTDVRAEPATLCR